MHITSAWRSIFSASLITAALANGVYCGAAVSLCSLTTSWSTICTVSLRIVASDATEDMEEAEDEAGEACGTGKGESGKSNSSPNCRFGRASGAIVSKFSIIKFTKSLNLSLRSLWSPCGVTSRNMLNLNVENLVLRQGLNCATILPCCFVTFDAGAVMNVFLRQS